MQLAVRLATTLLALTWIAPVAQAGVDFAHTFYLDNAKTLVSQRVDGCAHSVRDQPVDQALPDAMKRHGTAQMAATLSHEASFTHTKLPLLDDPFFNVFPQNAERNATGPVGALAYRLADT